MRPPPNPILLISFFLIILSSSSLSPSSSFSPSSVTRSPCFCPRALDGTTRTLGRRSRVGRRERQCRCVVVRGAWFEWGVRQEGRTGVEWRGVETACSRGLRMLFLILSDPHSSFPSIAHLSFSHSHLHTLSHSLTPSYTHTHTCRSLWTESLPSTEAAALSPAATAPAVRPRRRGTTPSRLWSRSTARARRRATSTWTTGAHSPSRGAGSRTGEGGPRGRFSHW
jgi:hypothetical protein